MMRPCRAYTVTVLETSGVFQERSCSPVVAGGDSTFDLEVDPPGP